MIVEGSEPFYFPGGTTGCLLAHGFTAMPEEMRFLGEHLRDRGLSVLGLRLAGHATHPNDLKRTRWRDWLLDVEDGLSMLGGACQEIYLIGQSMGGMVMLTAAAWYARTCPVAGVIAISTPYGGFEQTSQLSIQIFSFFQPRAGKRTARYPKDSPLYQRRELNYPAYPELPTRIYLEVLGLEGAFHAALPKVRVPVLLIHSTTDKSVPPADQQKIYDHLKNAERQTLTLEGLDHSMVMDERREEVFQAIDGFIHPSPAKP